MRRVLAFILEPVSAAGVVLLSAGCGGAGSGDAQAQEEQQSA